MPPAVSLGLMDWTKVSEPKPWSWTQVFLLQTICKARYVFMKVALLHNVPRLALPTAPSPKCPWLAEISKTVFEKEIIEDEKKKDTISALKRTIYFLRFTVILHKSKFTRPLNVVCWLSLHQYFQFPCLCLPLQTNPLATTFQSHLRLVVTGQ